MRQTRSYAPTYLDLDDTSARFLAYIEGEEVIKSFLADCVQNHLPADFDAEAEIDEVAKDIGTIFGNFAHDYKGETAEVYLIIKTLPTAVCGRVERLRIHCKRGNMGNREINKQKKRYTLAGWRYQLSFSRGF
jgi:hypothetical protein